MIGLSVAVGRFVEALFWAILRVAGSLAATLVAGALALLAIALLVRHFLKSSPARGGGPLAKRVVEGARDKGGAQPGAPPSPRRKAGAPPSRAGEE